MGLIAPVALVLSMTSIAVANMVGTTMNRVVFGKTGRHFWPAGANRSLFRAYRDLEGSDANVKAYIIAHVLGFVFFAIFSFTQFGGFK